MTPAKALPYSYRAYGCNLQSDIPLSRLSPGTDPGLDTITIQRCEVLPKVPDAARQLGSVAWAARNYLSLNIEGVVHFVAQNGNALHYSPHDGIDDMSVDLFLMGSGLGAILMQRELLVMHGNAIEIDGTCIMCVGPSGVGKSTTAAGLMQRGYRVMSDDVCAIDRHHRIVPGMPHIKLWQETADELGVNTTKLARVRPGFAKFGVPLDDAFCADLVPIRVIYALESHDSDEILCETLKAHPKFMTLRANTYRLPFVRGMDLGPLHFEQLTTLSHHVTVRRVRRPATGFQLDRLLDTLVADATQHAIQHGAQPHRGMP